jgi:Xaa-Pro aminopeptidase
MQQARIARLRAVMRDNDLSAMFITSDVNRFYMTGFTGSAGYVLITQSHAYLLTDFRYATQAPQQAVHYEVIEHQPSYTDTVKELLAQNGIDKLGFEQLTVTYGDYLGYKERLAGIELVPTNGVIEKLRMVKDENELEVMKAACELADRTFTHVLSYIRPGVSERDIAVELEMFMRRGGAASTSFETIVASGERSALPHGKASDRIVGTNEFVKLDYGALYRNYCSDITRTVVVGKASDKHKEIYSIVLEAQMYALEHIKPGMTGREADALARGIIEKYGYGDKFGHGLGHGLGIEIHEAPRLSKLGDMILEPGMTVTVEPGIYLPEFGGVRIEDDVVVTPTGVQRLTHSSKDLIVID